MTGWHYLAWGVLLVLFLSQLLRVKNNLQEFMSPRTVAVTGVFFLYVVSYLALQGDEGLSLMSYEGYLSLLSLCVLSILAYLGGYVLTARHGGWVKTTVYAHRDIQIMKLYALILMVLSLGAWFYFVSISGGGQAVYGSHHATGAAWEETSAYLYQLRQFFFPALFIVFGLLVSRRVKAYWGIICLGGVIFIGIDAWLQGKRGDYIALVIVFGVPLLYFTSDLTRRWRRSLLILAPAVLVVVLLVPYLRIATYIGAEVGFEQVFETLSEKNPLAGSHTKEGNELIYASGLMNALKTEVPDFGIEWLYPLVAFIPRALWQDKPYWSTFGQYVLGGDSLSAGELMYASELWVPGIGAATTGLVDGFMRFSWFSPLVWFVFGWWGGSAIRRAQREPSVKSLGYLCAYLLGLVYWITQDFKAAFYAWFYFFVPVWFCGVFTRLVRTALVDPAAHRYHRMEGPSTGPVR